MEGSDKKILIITDGSATIRQMAEDIAVIIGNNSDYPVTVVQAEHFAGTDLLASDAFFLGCEAPKPASFSYLEALFAHVNLAGRPCGIFSSNNKAIKYLSALVRDSDAVTAKPLLAKTGTVNGGDLQKWIKGVLGGYNERAKP